MDTLHLLRKDIDQIDREIIELLVQRRDVVKKIADFKRKNKLPVFQKKREEEQKAQYETFARQFQLSPRFLLELFATIQQNSREIQNESI